MAAFALDFDADHFGADDLVGAAVWTLICPGFPENPLFGGDKFLFWEDCALLYIPLILWYSIVNLKPEYYSHEKHQE